MLRKINELRGQKGSMMVEAIAMLGLISMVTPVIYKKAAERTMGPGLLQEWNPPYPAPSERDRRSADGRNAGRRSLRRRRHGMYSACFSP